MEKMVEVKWKGKTPKTIERPIPFVSKCEKEGDVTFNPTAMLPEHEAKYLVESGGMYELVEKVEEQPQSMPSQENEQENKPTPVIRRPGRPRRENA